MAEIQIQSDNHIYYFKTFNDFETHKDEILNNSQIFIGEMLSGGSGSSGLNIETIYNMTSDDPNINWGYTSGIKGATTISGKNFSKYKGLWVYINYSNLIISRVYIDLNYTPKNTEYAYNVVDVSGTEVSADCFSCDIRINMEKTSIALRKIGYFSGTKYNDRLSYESYYLYKIEGVY
jgi:hypothetical protein